MIKISPPVFTGASAHSLEMTEAIEWGEEKKRG